MRCRFRQLYAITQSLNLILSPAYNQRHCINSDVMVTTAAGSRFDIQAADYPADQLTVVQTREGGVAGFHLRLLQSDEESGK
jgi:hypothetical protein